MKFETYKKYREEFIKLYKMLDKNELGFVSLSSFNIRNFKKFIYLYSIDNTDCKFNNTVKSIIGKNQFLIQRDKYGTSIKIDTFFSMFDKYPEQYDNIISYYNKIKNLDI